MGLIYECRVLVQKPELQTAGEVRAHRLQRHYTRNPAMQR